LQKLHEIVRQIGRAARAKSLGPDRLESGYQRLSTLAAELLQRARALLRTLCFCVNGKGDRLVPRRADGAARAVVVHVQFTEKVCGTARLRVLLGATVTNEEKIFSMFQPHTELVKRAKQPDPIQYRHKVLVIEDVVGFICYYAAVVNEVLDQDVLGCRR
jgi:IS5 family transposase